MEKRVRKSEMKQEIFLLGNRIEKIIKEKGLKTREVAHDANIVTGKQIGRAHV